MNTPSPATGQETYRFEPMGEAHRLPVIDLFDHSIRTSFAAYPEEPVSYDFYDRFLAMARGYPAFVDLAGAAQVVGFGFLHAFHPFTVFRRTAEITYFLAPQHTRQGVGTMLLGKLLQAAKTCGVEVVLRFHARRGFCECGRFRRVGRNFGQAFDVVWMQLAIE